MSRTGSLGARLYRGELSYNIVGNRKRWYIISGVILLLAVTGLLTRGLNLGIEFKGGAEFATPGASCSVSAVRTAVEGAGVAQPVVTETGNDHIRVQTPALDVAQTSKVTGAIASTCQVAQAEVKLQMVGPSWGGEITKKALLALIVFLIAVTLFMSIYFEWRMAVAALVALVHDLVITIGIYALVGFEVTPATVIGVLTILGYSLYDTVVVFDKIKENTRTIAAQSRETFSEAANRALNQTLIRSINTSIVGLLPVAAILFVGVLILGAGTLQDLALALFVGTAAGTYSSIFIATPFLCQIKEHEPAMQALNKRVAARRSGLERKAVEQDAVAVGASSSSGARSNGSPSVGSSAADGGGSVSASNRATRPHRQAGPRNQPKRQSRSKRGK